MSMFPPAVLLAIHGGPVIHGFCVWLKASRIESPDREVNGVPA